VPPLRLSPAPPVVPPVVPLRARRPRPAVLASPALLALMAACGGAPTAVDPGPAEAPDSPPRSAPIGASPDGETPAGDTPAGDIPASGTPVSDAPESGSPASAPPTDPDAALAAQLTSCGADLPCAEAALRALPPPPGLSPRVDPLPALDARRAAAVAAADPALRASPAGVVTLEAAAAEGFAWGLYVGRGAAPAVAARVTGPHAPLLRTAFAVEAARLLAQRASGHRRHPRRPPPRPARAAGSARRLRRSAAARGRAGHAAAGRRGAPARRRSAGRPPNRRAGGRGLGWRRRPRPRARTRRPGRGGDRDRRPAHHRAAPRSRP